jgi:hypothetical protein
MQSEIGKAVENATSELLIGPDWSMNLAVCDMVNSRGEVGYNSRNIFLPAALLAFC